MLQLIRLIHASRSFLFFILLESIALLCIIQRKKYEKYTLAIRGKYYALSSFVKVIPQLRKINQNLLEENAELKNKILNYSNNTPRLCKGVNVINNTIIYPNNYLTIEQGSLQGIQDGMGVICDQGVVGIVYSVSKHYATVMSLLHTKIQISAIVTNNKDNQNISLGTVCWDGKDPSYAQMLHVPPQAHIQLGDQVVTSGYNSVFPPKTPIGVITNISIPIGDPFYTIKILLNTKFHSLSHVYIVDLMNSEKQHIERN